jgi:hypothetical protein
MEVWDRVADPGVGDKLDLDGCDDDAKCGGVKIWKVCRFVVDDSAEGGIFDDKYLVGVWNSSLGIIDPEGFGWIVCATVAEFEEELETVTEFWDVFCADIGS